jgi:hypothetical protein
MKPRESDREQEQHPDELFEDAGFVWKKSDAGYRCEDLRVIRDAGVDDKPSRVITDGAPMGLGDAVGYTPLWLPPDQALEVGKPLFAAFGATRPNEEGIVAFANTWGLLGERVWALPPESSEGIQRPRVVAEDLRAWKSHIKAMRSAVDLWRALESEDSERLAECLRWQVNGGPDGRGVWVYGGARGFKVISPPEGMTFTADDPAPPAGFHVQRWINEELRGRVSPRLLWNPEQQRRVIRIVPNNLLGAMWLQFARAIAGEVHYRPCKVCGRWLTISSDEYGYRTNRAFCSAACRQKDQRGKVKEARRLRSEGKSARQIAKHFNTTTDTIRNWLK